MDDPDSLSIYLSLGKKKREAERPVFLSYVKGIESRDRKITKCFFSY